MASTPADKSLGTVLLLGGCGFLGTFHIRCCTFYKTKVTDQETGYHLVETLLKDPACKQIIVASRNPTVNLHNNVTYRACDIVDTETLGALVREFSPRIIFHTVAPRPNDDLPKQEFLDTIIAGTKVVLGCASSSQSVEALVYTSSMNVYDGIEHINLDENAPLCTNKSSVITYNFAKAEADRMVRTASGAELHTVALRVGLMIGERDNGFIPGIVDAPTNVQMGTNKNCLMAVSVVDVANAHVIAAKSLLDHATVKQVDGEAFNIMGGHAIPFWDLSRMVWRAAGKSTEKFVILPVSLAYGLAKAVEFGFLLFTLGSKKSKAFNTLVVLYCVKDHTYNVEKARRVLGYKPMPVSSLEEEIKKSVKWELENRKI